MLADCLSDRFVFARVADEDLSRHMVARSFVPGSVINSERPVGRKSRLVVDGFLPSGVVQGTERPLERAAKNALLYLWIALLSKNTGRHSMTPPSLKLK
jgi:hypothetical protein